MRMTLTAATITMAAIGITTPLRCHHGDGGVPASGDSSRVLSAVSEGS
jgi:hypothetical protein